MPKLSNREKQIILLIGKGKTVMNIANLLGIGSNTVKSHKQRLFKKLYANDVITAVEHARLFGII